MPSAVRKAAKLTTKAVAKAEFVSVGAEKVTAPLSMLIKKIANIQTGIVYISISPSEKSASLCKYRAAHETGHRGSCRR